MASIQATRADGPTAEPNARACRDEGPGVTTSEVRADPAGAGRSRVDETVAHRHDALDVAGPGDQAMTDGDGLGSALQRHHAVLHDDRVPARLGAARDHLGHDLLADLRVSAVKDGQDVGPADDPDQPATLIAHGEALDLAVVHELPRVLQGVARADR